MVIANYNLESYRQLCVCNVEVLFLQKVHCKRELVRKARVWLLPVLLDYKKAVNFQGAVVMRHRYGVIYGNKFPCKLPIITFNISHQFLSSLKSHLNFCSDMNNFGTPRSCAQYGLNIFNLLLSMSLPVCLFLN